MKLAEIAERINAHLKRFEKDPKTNPLDPKYKTRPFYVASASAPKGARTVAVLYVCYQGASKLDREDALAYLAWLDAGNVGRHYEQQREAKETSK